MSRVQLVNLVKRFDKTMAVNGVSLDIDDGQFVVLLGPSGCGKTTMLRCISGLETPDSGDILIDGARVNALSPRDRDVAMVFQNYALYPHMSVFDNIAFPLRMRGTNRGETKEMIKEVAKLLNIEHLLSRRPRQLSGGEQQRVALGRAMVRKPKVFLMDEPLSNLDAKLRLHMRAELKKLRQDLGITTVYVTHDQAEAMALADKVAVLNKGEVMQYGTPPQIYNGPANTFVAGFIGSPPMNLMQATIIENNGLVTLDTGSFIYRLTAELSERVRGNLTGTSAYLGISPENLHLSIERNDESVFEAEIYVIEPMGPYVLIDLKSGDNIVKALSPSIEGLGSAQKVWVGFRYDKVHIFDATTEKAII